METDAPAVISWMSKLPPHSPAQPLCLRSRSGATVVVRPGRLRPAHRVAGIALADLFRTASRLGNVRGTLEAFPAPEPAVRAALSWLVAEGFLTAGDAKPASAAGGT